MTVANMKRDVPEAGGTPARAKTGDRTALAADWLPTQKQTASKAMTGQALVTDGGVVVTG